MSDLSGPEGAAASLLALQYAEHCAGTGAWHEDLRTGVTTVTAGLSALLGAEIHPQTFTIRAFDHPDDAQTIARAIASQSGGAYTCDHRIQCAGGRVRAVRERLRTIVDQSGHPVARIGTFVDISDLKEREAELAELALYDGLTRLPNRSALHERLGDALARCERSDRRCAVLFADLDDFKIVNDAYGHTFGDQLLARVAERLSRHIRSFDTVARLGGDEFLIVIDELLSDDGALDAARKILRSFEEPFVLGERSVSLRASIGVATYPRCGTTAERLIEAADRAMYVVKRNGGNGVTVAASQEETADRDDENEESCQPRYSKGRHPFDILESA